MYTQNVSNVAEGNYHLHQKLSDFNSVVIPHFAALKRYAQRMTNFSEESNDLVQETMLKAFRFFDRFEKGTNIKGWLYRIMFNTFINDYRKKRKAPSKIEYESIQSFYDYINIKYIKISYVEHDVFHNTLSDEVNEAISSLPDIFRTIVFLCDIEGFSYQEISDFMGCPLGSVRSRLHRARKMLYTLLYNYADANGYIMRDTKKE